MRSKTPWFFVTKFSTTLFDNELVRMCGGLSRDMFACFMWQNAHDYFIFLQLVPVQIICLFTIFTIKEMWQPCRLPLSGWVGNFSPCGLFGCDLVYAWSTRFSKMTRDARADPPIRVSVDSEASGCVKVACACVCPKNYSIENNNYKFLCYE